MKLEVQDIKSLVQSYRDEAVHLLQRVVQTPSPTGQELEISRLMKDYMEAFGLEVQTYEYEKGRPNLLSEWVGNPDGKKFIFNGHMDVFPPNKGIEGKFGPWSGTIEDGKLYGRGSTDMKAGDCAALMAVRILKENGYVPNGKILLSYMVDEENTSEMGVLSLLKHGLLKDGDFGVCMEPSDKKILMQEGGVWQTEVTYLASGGHSAMPNTEKDALMKSITAITELYKLRETVEKRNFPGIGQPFLQINTLNTGGVSNVRASKSTFSIDRRFAPEEGFEQVKAEILGVLDGLKDRDPEYDYTLKEVAFYPCAKRDENNEAIKTMIRACEEIHGHPVERFGRFGSSDSVHIIDQSSIQMPIYGPGKLETCGTANEYVELEDYLSSIMIYIRMVDQLLGQKEE